MLLQNTSEARYPRLKLHRRRKDTSTPHPVGISRSINRDHIFHCAMLLKKLVKYLTCVSYMPPFVGDAENETQTSPAHAAGAPAASKKERVPRTKAPTHGVVHTPSDVAYCRRRGRREVAREARSHAFPVVHLQLVLRTERHTT